MMFFSLPRIILIRCLSPPAKALLESIYLLSCALYKAKHIARIRHQWRTIMLLPLWVGTCNGHDYVKDLDCFVYHAKCSPCWTKRGVNTVNIRNIRFKSYSSK